jgi:ceramide glucosyltransferase
MLTTLSLVLFGAAVCGVVLLAVQQVALRLHLAGGPARRPRRRAPVSILKPLCGVDDDLEANLERFATLDYAAYEVVLGVRDERDAAYPLAVAAAMRWPDRVRVVLQRGAPGLNPKVNQLVTLASAARHEILVVSDSNVRVPDGYLDELVALFEDPTVGCVTHPVAGADEQTLGSLLDNLHLASSVGAGQVAAKRVAGRDLVVGKSMALRRADLERLGGFAAFADYLAEDYVIGQRVGTVLGKRVAVARTPVINVSRRRSVGDFYRRYARWSVIHRTAIAPSTYMAQSLLNPTPIALVALALAPSLGALACVTAIGASKAALDVGAGRALRPGGFGVRALACVAVKDLLLAAAWVHGLSHDTVLWRGNRLRVLPGSRLARAAAAALPDVPVALSSAGTSVSSGK